MFQSKWGGGTKYFQYSIAEDANVVNTRASLSKDITNTVFANISSTSNGGVIYNSNSSEKYYNITADFIGNSASNGGAIYNYINISVTRIGDITGDFIGNTASDSGGAIYNYEGTISNITGDFIGNTASRYGGAIDNYYSSIGNITGNFIGNSASYGGAIANYDTRWDTYIRSITGNFIGNTATSGGAIYNYASGTYGFARIRDITGDFIGNKASSGGAIYNSYKAIIENITGDFIGNTASGFGGAIFNSLDGEIENITGNFIGNSASNGGAIANSNSRSGGTIYYIEGNFINNSATNGNGGAIYNNKGTIECISGNFIGNSAKSESSTAQGGAIWTGTDIYFLAENNTNIFKDNYTQVGEEKDDNAIYVGNAATIYFYSISNGKIEMFDNIRGSEGYSVNITGDGTGTFGMYNDMYDANVSIGAVNLNTVNNLVHTYNFNSLTLTGDVNATVDVDLANAEMDRFTAASYGNHAGTLNVIGMNLLSDAKSEITEILFADTNLKDAITSSVSEVPHSIQLKAYTPIYKYDVSYDNREDGGYFVFNGGSGFGANSSDAYNPAVLSAPVANTAAAQATVNETFKYVFEHSDAFTQMPSIDRQAMIKANRYALSTDYNENLGSLNSVMDNKAGWFRAYTSIENMNLKHGPKVDAITYGSLVGFDTDFFEHKDGWYSVGTGYVGYNGSLLSYSGVDTTMNGGLLGYTHTMYKDNFWSALTLTAGASVGESRTMYGKEDFTTLMAGLGSKTGYNFEFKEGRFIIQPIMFMSYTFANTFDYTNAAGVKIKPSPAHSIQLNPSVRFIANTKNGWQPYASVGMVWNVFNQNKVMANAVRLPETSMKPYVEYGLGIQRNWKDRFTAFGQAMVRNGGRNGIALTAGFRWTIGAKPTEKVNAPKPERKVIKQITPKQKMAMD